MRTSPKNNLLEDNIKALSYQAQRFAREWDFFSWQVLDDEILIERLVDENGCACVSCFSC